MGCPQCGECVDWLPLAQGNELFICPCCGWHGQELDCVDLPEIDAITCNGNGPNIPIRPTI